jgi:uncharacterized RDD family membrane protein YckC
MEVIYTRSGDKVELADMGTRLMAFALDLFLMMTLVGITDLLTFSSNEEAFLLKPERLLHLVLGWLYFAGLETCPCQATVGKYLLNLRVTTTTDERISFRAASIRYFAKPLTLFVVLANLLTKSTSHHSPRTYHDKLANTQVVVR